MHRWHATGPEIRADTEIEGEILEFLGREGVKSVVITDGSIGCPHEQGIDYEGEWCPDCPYWRTGTAEIGSLESALSLFAPTAMLSRDGLTA